MTPSLICDAQIHAPDLPTRGRNHGINMPELLAEMDQAGVHRAVLVPLSGVQTEADPAGNAAACDMARAHPDRFAVMGLVPLDPPDARPADFTHWRDAPGMRGVRASFVRDPNRSLLADGQLGWFWEAAEKAGIPLMLNVPGQVAAVGDVAGKYPGLRLIIDHAGLTPYHTYPEGITEALAPALALAGLPNVAVKATAFPCAVDEAYPFPGLRAPIRQLVDAYGPERVFWGSDLTRSPWSYRQAVTHFTEELDFLSPADLELIMGRAISAWLDWPA